MKIRITTPIFHSILFPPCIIVELEPRSFHFDCTLRNDSPYYWCGVDGLIKNPDPNLPKKVGTVFQRVVSEKTKGVANKLIQRLKDANNPVFLIAPTGYYIENGEFGNYMQGIYNQNECMHLFYDYSACPKTAKKFDLYGNQYIEK